MRQVNLKTIAALLLVDIIIITLSLYLSLYLRFLGQVPAVFIENLNNIIIPAVFINLSAYYLLGLYRKQSHHTLLLRLLKVSLSVFSGLLLTYMYSIFFSILPRSVFLFALVLNIILLMVHEYFIKGPIIEHSLPIKVKWLDLKKLSFTFSDSSYSFKMIVVLVMCAVLVNILQFKGIDSTCNNRYKAINREPSSCILVFGLYASPVNRQMYGMAVELSRVKHGLTVITPQDDHYTTKEFNNRLLSFGRAAEIKQMNYDASTFLPDFDYEQFVFSSGEGGDRGDPFVIAFQDNQSKSLEPTAFIVLRRNSTDVLIDVDLLPEGALEGLK